MGDSSRFIATADFMLRNYTKAKNILCVADGQGQLASILKVRGYDTTIIDPRFKGFNKKIKGLFCRDTNVDSFDLLVGLHPDEATAEIIHAAKRNEKHALIIPCCKLGIDANKAGDWWKYLVSISPGDKRIYQQHFRGKNMSIFF